MLGMKIDIDVKNRTLGENIQFDVEEVGSSINILVDESCVGKSVNIYVEDEYICSSQVGKKARIKIDKRSENGRKLMNAMLVGNKLKVLLN